MEKASRVMYSIANFFTWIIVILCIAGIVCSVLGIANVLHTPENLQFVGVGSLVYLIIVLIVSLITIWMVRRAKDKNSSKLWDLLFLILGIFGGNIFYVLGGIFGLVAVRRQLNHSMKKAPIGAFLFYKQIIFVNWQS